MFKTYQLADLPQDIPLFPIAGVVLLPQFHLPLNIFEPRYTQMVDDVLAGPRLVGVVQPKDTDGRPNDKMPALYNVGCMGRITGFEETNDGRYLVNLTGICRFKIIQEIPVSQSYRTAGVDFSDYLGDLEKAAGFKLDRKNFLPLLKDYFTQKDFELDWDAIESAGDIQLMNTLAMVCPFDIAEKQALLEAATLADRAEMMQALLAIGTSGATGSRQLH